MRKLNKRLLKNFLATQGRLAKESLAAESKISYTKICRLLRSEAHADELEMESLARATGFGLDALFPDSKETA